MAGLPGSVANGLQSKRPRTCRGMLGAAATGTQSATRRNRRMEPNEVFRLSPPMASNARVQPLHEGASTWAIHMQTGTRNKLGGIVQARSRSPLVSKNHDENTDWRLPTNQEASADLDMGAYPRPACNLPDMFFATHAYRFLTLASGARFALPLRAHLRNRIGHATQRLPPWRAHRSRPRKRPPHPRAHEHDSHVTPPRQALSPMKAHLTPIAARQACRDRHILFAPRFPVGPTRTRTRTLRDVHLHTWTRAYMHVRALPCAHP